MNFRHFRLIILGLATGLSLPAAEGELTRESPFLPAGAAAAPAIESSGVQLAGISEITPQVYVLLVGTGDAGKNRGRWLVVGTKTDDLEVVSCDVDRSEAVVRIGSELKTLVLRKPASAKSGAGAVSVTSPPIPNVGPAGGALPPVKPLVTREEQEREARMLVSDLMEIGMRQRKAYEEAQKKAAEEAAKKGTPKT
jgi:hypothetical protein